MAQKEMNRNKFTLKISLQGLCLIAARFLLEQQQLWESHLYFAREQGYNMVSQRGSEQLYATMPSWVQHEKSQSAAWRAGSTSAEPCSLEAERERGDDPYLRFIL